MPTLLASNLLTPGGLATQFGNPAVGGTTTTAAVDVREGSKFTTDQPFTVARVVAYLDGLGAGTGNQAAKAVIYAGDGTFNAGALQAATSEVSVADGQAAGWVDFPFPAPPTIQAGTYWLMLHTGAAADTIRWYRDGTANGAGFIGDAYADGPTSNGGTLTPTLGVRSVYASTIPGAGGGGGGGQAGPVLWSDATPVLWSDAAPANWVN